MLQPGVPLSYRISYLSLSSSKKITLTFKVKTLARRSSTFVNRRRLRTFVIGWVSTCGEINNRGAGWGEGEREREGPLPSLSRNLKYHRDGKIIQVK